MSKPYLKVTKDFTDTFNETLKAFKHDAVLVGIPEQKAERKEDDPINNATLLAMNEFGMPAMNIPPRPVMKLGIKKAQSEISDQFKLAAKNALTQGFKALNIYYNRAGIIASTSIKKVINSQIGFKGPSDATLKARKAKGFKGESALIVTGQMRNAITYVINESGQ